jgi:hypothetical protein
VIIDAIVGSLLGVLTWLVELLPEAGDLGLSASGSWFRGFAELNTYLPLGELVAGGVLLVAIEGAMFTVRAVSWARAQIPWL